MIQKWLKRKVIPLSFWADRMAMDVVRHPLDEHERFFIVRDSGKYFECKFYSYIASKWAVNQFDNEYERELYNKSLKKMIRFKEVNKMVIGLESFTWNLKTLYLDLQRNITNNNFTSRKMDVNQILLHDIREMVVKYIALVDALKEYPEWQHKVKEEPGHYIHLIHNNLQEAEKAWLFEGFDKHEYFV